MAAKSDLESASKPYWFLVILILVSSGSWIMLTVMLWIMLSVMLSIMLTIVLPLGLSVMPSSVSQSRGLVASVSRSLAVSRSGDSWSRGLAVARSCDPVASQPRGLAASRSRGLEASWSRGLAARARLSHLVIQNLNRFPRTVS